MSKDNSNFFKEKKVWSAVKDELLRCYLVPYFEKLFMTRIPILYIDCFAGKVTAYSAYKSFYNECASEVIAYCKERGIAYHIKEGTMTES